MPDDPLAQFRKTPTAPPAGVVAPPKGTEEYAAFGTKDKVLRLKIRSAMAPVHSVPYNILLDVVYDGVYGLNFVLNYSILLVLVRGRNLQKIVFAIENGMADFIQEFDPDRWAKPTDENAAIIESIEIKVVQDTTPAFDPENPGVKKH
jgi:hypothetical protein